MDRPADANPIEIETFTPEGDGPHPLIVLLHGSGGMRMGGPIFRDVAHMLAQRGYLVLLPHYFDRTGTVVADPAAHRRHFETWVTAVGEMVADGLARPDVAPGRVGLLGFSLGAYLALAEATFDPRVGAVVAFFGGLPDALAGRADRLPPTLVLHGDADPVVPVAEARKLQALLERHDVAHEVVIYPGQGHSFHGETARDAERRTVGFFDAHLRSSG